MIFVVSKEFVFKLLMFNLMLIINVIFNQRMKNVS